MNQPETNVNTNNPQKYENKVEDNNNFGMK